MKSKKVAVIGLAAVMALSSATASFAVNSYMAGTPIGNQVMRFPAFLST